MRGALVASLAVLAAALAGCSGGTGDGQEGDGPQGGGDGEASAGLQVPAWAVRDYWTYSSTFGDATYVVTSDAGSDWLVDTTNLDSAFLDAREDVSRLGPQRKSDLAGSQGDDRVEFFRWPLVAGANWTTTWDGTRLAIEVVDVQDGQASLRATNATGGLVYTYAYDASARWFRSIEAYAPDGTVARSFELTQSGHNYTGEVVRWHLETLRDYEGTGPSQTDASSFEVPDDATDLWMRFHIECPDDGGYTLAFAPAAPDAPDQAYQIGDQCTGPPLDVQEVVVEQPAAGPWAYLLDFGGGPTPPTATVLLLARTLETLPVP